MDDASRHYKIMPLHMDTSVVTEDRKLQGRASIPNNQITAFLAKGGETRHLNADPRGITWEGMDERLLMMPIGDYLL